jgi:DNA-binding transcriptional MerR regulator
MERYRLADLVSATGVTQRTIRFYIAEGLLPPPEGAGPAAVYTSGHHDRLLLINRLKDGYLPLREIRRRLAPMTDDEVRAELRQLAEATPAAPGGGAAMMPQQASAAAVDYLDEVLGRGGAREVARPVPPPVYFPPLPYPAPRPPAPAPARERWERIVLADGVELHVREDRLREAIPLDALVRQARKLLGES